MNAASLGSDRAAVVVDAVARYRARNPASERQFNAATGVLPGGNTRSVLFHEPFPLTMAAIYLLLLLYFKSIGGYKPVHIDEQK